MSEKLKYKDITEKIIAMKKKSLPRRQAGVIQIILSYDIVKAHGGEILVESREGEGTNFMIKL